VKAASVAFQPLVPDWKLPFGSRLVESARARGASVSRSKASGPKARAPFLSSPLRLIAIGVASWPLPAGGPAVPKIRADLGDKLASTVSLAERFGNGLGPCPVELCRPLRRK